VASGEAGFTVNGMLSWEGAGCVRLFAKGWTRRCLPVGGEEGPAPAAGAGVARLGRGGGGLPPLKACRVSVIPSPVFLTVSAFDCLATEYGHS
jgi:hypothetical protein